MISALDRLRALRARQADTAPDALHPDDLPMEWRIEYEERAAILEYDGRLSRQEAEEQAIAEITARRQHMDVIEGRE